MTTDKNKFYKNDSPKKAYHRAWYWKNRDKILIYYVYYGIENN